MSKTTQETVRQTIRELVLNGKLVIGWDFWNCLGLMRSFPVEPLADVGKLALNLPLDTNSEMRTRFVEYCNTVNVKDRQSFLNDAAREFGTTVPPHGLAELNRIIDIELKCCTTFNDVKPVLRSILSANIPQGIISNIWTFPTDHIFGKREDVPECDCSVEAAQLTHLLPSMELGKFFKHLLLSCEVGFSKPHPEIFLEFCRRFGVRPENVLFIGDSVPSDVEGALAVGMMAAFIDRPQELLKKENLATKQALEDRGMIYLTSLSELPDILGIQKSLMQS